MRAIAALVWRDALVFVRQPARVGATLATPAILWLVIAAGAEGLGDGFAVASGVGIDARGYLLPGALLLMVVFSGLIGGIGLIQDRAGGVLQVIEVGPTPRWAVASARVLWGVLSALVQGSVLCALAWSFGVGISGWALVVLGLVVGVSACFVGSVVVSLAWWSGSVASFHGIANLVLPPMWLLSGALFPASTAAGWLSGVMHANPLWWGHRAMVLGLGGSFDGAGAGVLGLCAAVMLLLMLGVVDAGRRRVPGQARGRGDGAG